MHKHSSKLDTVFHLNISISALSQVNTQIIGQNMIVMELLAYPIWNYFELIPILINAYIFFLCR